MDFGLIIALVVAITLTLIAGVLAGLFGGMWWQARKTAEVWEKAYTHVRELLPAIKHDTYNTGRTQQRLDDRDAFTPVPEPMRTEPPAKERVVVQAATSPPPPPVVPSAAAREFGGVTLEDDPFGHGNRLDGRTG